MVLIGCIVLLDNICVTHLFMIGRYASFARSDWYTLKGIVGRFQITVPVPWPNDFREIFENVNVRARHREFYEFIYFFCVLKFIDWQIWNILVSRPKLAFNLTFVFCSPICPNNCGVVFLWKYILVFEKWLFSFDRSNMQIFTVNITRVVWPHVTNILDLQFFCQHNPLFYHLNLIPFHYWSRQRNIYFLVNISIRHTFPMSKVTSKQRQF